MDLPLFVIVPAPMVRKLIVLGLLSPKPLEADFFLEISKTSENKKRHNSYPFPLNSSKPPSSITSTEFRNLKKNDINKINISLELLIGNLNLIDPRRAQGRKLFEEIR